MELLKMYGKEIFSVLITLLTWTLNNYYKGKARLVMGFLHEFSFLLNEPLYDENSNLLTDKQLVHTRSIVVVNEGRESANNLSIVFNYKPMYINFWPIHHYQEFIESDDRYIVVFESLSPKDSIRCEILSINRDLPAVLGVRSKECVAKMVSILPQKAMSPVLSRVRVFLVFLGMAASIYITILILQWLIVKTG